VDYFYTYYVYEEWGRGYIGASLKGCKCHPSEDTYMGSFKDKTFKPTEKIILGIYSTIKETIEAEILLHNFFEVAKNPHFANRAKQTSAGFNRAGVLDTEDTREKKSLAQRKLHAESKKKREQISKLGQKYGPLSFLEKTGIFTPGAINKATLSKGGKISGRRNVLTGHLDKIRTFDICSRGGKTSGTQCRDQGKAIFSPEVRERALQSLKKAALQKWFDPDHPELGCHNPGNLVKIQRKNGYPSGLENRVKLNQDLL